MNKDQKVLAADELDTIGEIMNISMGAAATAVSTMLERQVVITTPHISQDMLKNVDVSDLEPAIIVKIKYVEGIAGTSMIMLRRNDMRIILDLLMGNDESDEDDFEFDEMSMSAACEVMNQMMGASATALSELLNKPINISTPQAMLVETAQDAKQSFTEIDDEESVLAISFKMSIKETLDTTFTSIMSVDLTKEIVRSLNGEVEDEVYEPEPPYQPEPMPQPPVQTPLPAQPEPQPQYIAPQPEQHIAPQPVAQQNLSQSTPQAASPQPIPQQQMNMPPQYAQPPAQQQAPQNNAYQQPPYQPPMDYGYQQQIPYVQQMQYPPQYMQPPYPGAQYPPPYGMYQDSQQPMQPIRYPAPMVNVKQADFPEFTAKNTSATPYSSNMNMLMGVQLDVSVIVGRSKEKIKDVLEFGQGSVIELDKQTGAPAEVVVNGQLLAYGDVVVVGDNFGVRITEIVGTKELLDSLENKK